VPVPPVTRMGGNVIDCSSVSMHSRITLATDKTNPGGDCDRKRGQILAQQI
jgi:hypothetical protein